MINAEKEGFTTYGNTKYSNTSTAYEDSIVKGYVDAYVEILNTSNPELNATGRLMNQTELDSFGCVYTAYTCSNAPEWLYSTSFWTEHILNSHYVFRLESDNYFYLMSYDYPVAEGVRPVIEFGV
mgnify:CR=1 FL=1